MIDTSVVDAGVELDDYGAAPDGLEEVRRRLHRPAGARAGPVAAAAAAHLARCARCGGVLMLRFAGGAGGCDPFGLRPEPADPWSVSVPFTLGPTCQYRL